MSENFISFFSESKNPFKWLKVYDHFFAESERAENEVYNVGVQLCSDFGISLDEVPLIRCKNSNSRTSETDIVLGLFQVRGTEEEQRCHIRISNRFPLSREFTIFHELAHYFQYRMGRLSTLSEKEKEKEADEHAIRLIQKYVPPKWSFSYLYYHTKCSPNLYSYYQHIFGKTKVDRLLKAVGGVFEENRDYRGFWNFITGNGYT